MPPPLNKLFLTSLILFSTISISAQRIPETDRRQTEIRHLDLTYTLPEYRTKEEWLTRAEFLRKQILFSAGLWPMPEKQPVKPVIFDRKDRGDYTVEKVYFESLPGFYVTGNLYRPKNTNGKAPAVLCPHGHWTYGRLENTPLNSGPARAASFARQGYIAFSYDMVGYNDSAAISHRFADHNTTGREALWNVNLLGLQLWNSIRSVDFLLSLPEVDSNRIACTGESGGGIQTFLLMAVDPRIGTAAPVNMLSFIMQGGSLCENAPNLRIDTNNVEFGALMAPRPMIMISATGDWTKNTLTSEYPAISRIYQLFGAEEKVTAIQVNAPHNYNQESREAVYGWFAHWMLGRPEITPVKERGNLVSPLTDLLVYFSRPRPENELDEPGLAGYMIESRKLQFEKSFPTDSASLESFKNSYGVGLKYALMAQYPDQVIAGEAVASDPEIKVKGVIKEDRILSRPESGDRVSLSIWRRPQSKSAASSIVLIACADSRSDQVNDLAAEMINSGHIVAAVGCFPGNRQIPSNIKFFTTYNRTDEANRVQDILTATSYLRSQFKGAGISLIGAGQSGLLALLARALAPRFDKTVIDVSKFDIANDQEFIRLLPIPGIRHAGDLLTAVTTAPLSPLLLHNAGERFDYGKLGKIYAVMGKTGDFRSEQSQLPASQISAWLR